MPRTSLLLRLCNSLYKIDIGILDRGWCWHGCAAWAAVFGIAYQGDDNEDASTASFAAAGALGCVAVGSFLASYFVGRDSGCCVRYTP